MKSILAGTETKKLQDVLEVAFGSDEDDDEDIPTEEEKEEASTSSGVKRKTSQPQGSSKWKASHPTKAGICALTDPTVYYPTTLDASTSYLHAGVDYAFYLSQESSQVMKSAGYKCNYFVSKKAEGVSTPDCTSFSTMTGQLSIHIRQHHLGLAMKYFICPGKCWWSASAWMEHMKKAHSELGQDAYFVKEGADVVEAIVVKQEVASVDV